MDLSALHFTADYQVKNTRIHADKSLFAKFLVLQIRKKKSHATGLLYSHKFLHILPMALKLY